MSRKNRVYTFLFNLVRSEEVRPENGAHDCPGFTTLYRWGTQQFQGLFFFVTELTPTSTWDRSQQGNKCILFVLTGAIRTPSTTASFLVFVGKKVLLKSYLNSIRREDRRCSESKWVDRIQRKHTEARRSLEWSQGSWKCVKCKTHYSVMNFLRQSCDDSVIFALKMETPGLNDTKQLSQRLVTGNNT